MQLPITTPIRRRQERLAFMGEVVTIRLEAADTAGALSVIEHDMRVGLATPLHVHPNEDETLLVLAGALTVHLDGREFNAVRGDLVWLPRGLPHAFRVESDNASTVAITTPGGQEGFFRAVGDAVDTPAGAPDFGRMAEAAARAGFEILGPPPFGQP